MHAAAAAATANSIRPWLGMLSERTAADNIACWTTPPCGMHAIVRNKPVAKELKLLPETVTPGDDKHLFAMATKMLHMSERSLSCCRTCTRSQANCIRSCPSECQHLTCTCASWPQVIAQTRCIRPSPARDACCAAKVTCTHTYTLARCLVHS